MEAQKKVSGTGRAKGSVCLPKRSLFVAADGMQGFINTDEDLEPILPSTSLFVGRHGRGGGGGNEAVVGLLNQAAGQSASRKYVIRRG